MIYEKNHWNEICQKVAKKCFLIFPHIKSKKLKSEIVSNLFETQTEDYFNQIKINVKSAQSDKDPDLVFPDHNIVCEVKVTGADSKTIKSCKWMGGKYSKRTSDYIFVIWNYVGEMNTPFGKEEETMNFFVVKTFVNEEEWKTIDNDKGNYYATVINSSDIMNKECKELVGHFNGTVFVMEEFHG